MTSVRYATVGRVPEARRQAGTPQEARVGNRQHLAAACQETGSWEGGSPVRQEAGTAGRQGDHPGEGKANRPGA